MQKTRSLRIHLKLLIICACLPWTTSGVHAISGQFTGNAADGGNGSEAQEIIVFMKEGGWCWFQDPRAIISKGQLYLGSVRGNGSGPALVGIYDLEERTVIGSSVMQDDFHRDDHNSPVLHAFPDGRILAMYALHNKGKVHYYRKTLPGDPIAWGNEMSYIHDYPAADKVTYMNLYYLANEGKMYNFFRGINFNPCFITSVDEGQRWGEPTHFIASELEGRHRPYARYAGDGRNTIHVSFTDAHPHLFGNNIYYTAFRNGNFYRAGISQEDDVSSIEWKAVTSGSAVRNIRPLIVRGDGYRVIAWLRGRYSSYRDYQLDVVGVIVEIQD